jgi:hypothetical protein
VKPLQFQLNNAGLLHISLANLFNDKDKKHVQMQEWITPGIEVGFHLSPSFYIGYGLEPNRQVRVREFMSLSNVAPEGTSYLDLHSLESHRINLRYFPLEVDCYAELGVMRMGSVSHSMDFDRYGEAAKYGDNFYATDLSIEWRRPAHWAPTLGFGYNWVYRSGFSFDVGCTVPIDVLKQDEFPVEIDETQANVFLSAEDRDLLSKSVANYSFYSPVTFRLNVGYNFSMGERKEKRRGRDRGPKEKNVKDAIELPNQ